MNWADPHVDAMRFAGHWRDFLGQVGAESKDYIDSMHARNYDPNVGRFLSVDPVMDREKAVREPQQWNRYAYVRNNPLRFVDPDGRQAKPQCTLEKCPPPAPVDSVVRLTPKNIEQQLKNGTATPAKITSTGGSPPTKGLLTFTAGLNVSVVALGGGSAGVGVMHANRIGTEHAAVEAFGGVHGANTFLPRGSAGLQGVFGMYRGGVTDQRGAFTELNIALGQWGGTLSFTKAGGFVGGALVYGPSVGPGGVSVSETNTMVLTGKEALDAIGVDP